MGNDIRRGASYVQGSHNGIHIHIYIYIYTYIHIYLYIYTYLYIHTHIYMHTYIHIHHSNISLSTYTNIYTYIYIYTHVYICIYRFMRTHTRTRLEDFGEPSSCPEELRHRNEHKIRQGASRRPRYLGLTGSEARPPLRSRKPDPPGIAAQ